MLAGQQIEQQPVIRVTVDEVTLPLAADGTEVEALDQAQRRIPLDDPGIDGLKAEIPESQGQHFCCSQRSKSAVAEAFVALRSPQCGAPEVEVHAVQTANADRD